MTEVAQVAGEDRRQWKRWVIGVKAEPQASPRLGTRAAPGRDRVDLLHIARLAARFLGGEGRLFAFALGLLVLEAITAVFEAYPLAYLIDYLQKSRPDLHYLDWLRIAAPPTVLTVAQLTIAIIALAIVNSFADATSEIYLARGGRTLGYNLRSELHAHLQRLSIAFHDRRHTGDILTRITGDVAALENFIVGSLSDITASLLVLVGTLAFLVYTSWQVALVAALVVPLVSSVSNHFAPRIRVAAKTQRAREGDLASATQEMLGSIRVLQAYSLTRHAQARFSGHSAQAKDAALEAAVLQARFGWTIKVLEALAICGIVWIGLLLVNQGTITVGTLILFIILVENMFRPTRRIIKEWNNIGRIYASVERIGEVLDRRPAVEDGPHAKVAPPFRGHVSFRHVSFAYHGDPEDTGADQGGTHHPRPALKDVSFDVAPGQVLALVGQTGAGKSTVAQLLPRLYDPDEGVVAIDGRDIREFTLESLRSQISIVLQETILLSGSVAENIGLGRPGASEAEIVEAAMRANAQDFIQELPEGYETQLGERGANLSGGERQRVAIARAFIRGAPILILDEPTTGLDAENSRLVLRALRTLMEGKTTVLISHDLSLIHDADRIIVIQDGQIVESGTHGDLLNAGGLYASLYHQQFDQPGPGDRGTEKSSTPAASGDATERETPAIAVGQAGERSLSPSEAPMSIWMTLSQAMDGEKVQPHLQATLFGPAPSRYEIEGCAPGSFIYSDSSSASLRFGLQVRDHSSGQLTPALVNARIFTDLATCRAFLKERLLPLADLVRSREEIAMFTSPVALAEPWRMAISTFPIDAELPTLVQATDRQYMIGVLRESLPEARQGSFAIEDCQVEVVHYRPKNGCALRYKVFGRQVSTGSAETRTIYGKVEVDADGPGAQLVMTALRARLRDDPAPFSVPRPLGFRSDLQLSLMEAIGGTPRLKYAIAACLTGASDSRADDLSLEGAIDASARIAATLHALDLPLVRRTVHDELNEIRRAVDLLAPISPERAPLFRAVLARLVDESAASQPLELRVCHGDYSHSQIVFDAQTAGLVDFDTVCLAEPALDLGQYLAYLRLVTLKAERRLKVGHNSLAGDMSARFVDAYVAACAGRLPDEELLRTRVSLYEIISLMRIALHGWQKMKTERLGLVLEILEERMRVYSE